MSHIAQPQPHARTHSVLFDVADELTRIDETANALGEAARLLMEDGGNMGPVGHLINTIAEVLTAHTQAALRLMEQESAS
jgi:signal-transduction protein with cAMP-binding, CBS, and nucleotidyltransferase domain